MMVVRRPGLGSSALSRVVPRRGDGAPRTDPARPRTAAPLPCVHVDRRATIGDGSSGGDCSEGGAGRRDNKSGPVRAPGTTARVARPMPIESGGGRARGWRPLGGQGLGKQCNGWYSSAPAARLTFLSFCGVSGLRPCMAQSLDSD